MIAERSRSAAPVRGPARIGSRWVRVVPVRRALGKVLELAGMLTLGMALFVYGLGEEDMSAELGWLLVGSVIFLLGYLLERRASREG
jgi:hypothetical protein